jgi:thiol-disulfide isomerase/thioredoxin
MKTRDGFRGWRGILAGLALAALFVAMTGAGSAESLVHKRAPEFARSDLNGKPVSLARFHGKVLLLNFWATWCAPCQAEMPVFAGWQRKYGPQGLQVIGISMDDDAAPVRRLLAKLKLNYPVAMGDARLGQRYGGVLGLPLTFLIDRDGVVRAQFQGETDLKSMEMQVRALLPLTARP